MKFFTLFPRLCYNGKMRVKHKHKINGVYYYGI